MATIDELTRIREAFLTALDERSDEAVARMRDAYEAIIRTLTDDLEREIALIMDDSDGDSSAALRLARTRRLLAQVQAELDAFAGVAQAETDGLIDDGIEAAREAFTQEMNTMLGPAGARVGFDVLPVAAIRQQVAALADGSPLADLFEQMGPLVREMWSQALVSGIARGDNPRKVARTLAGVTIGGLVRATRIARTEMMRAYRESHHANYKANSKLIKGWMWIATFQPRTCPACLSRHGQIFPLSQKLNDHPNGRCTPAPVTKTWEELGIEGIEETSLAAQTVETGQQWFDRQDAGTQRQILGSRGYEEYRAGRVKLEDFVTIRRSAKWGDSIQAASVETALANARKRNAGRGAGGASAPSSPRPQKPPGEPARPQPQTPADLDRPAREGTPVSAALKISQKPGLKNARLAAQLIDSVHTDGKLPEIQVVNERMPKGMQGYFQFSSITGAPVKIALRSRMSFPIFTAIHEIGHFLDRDGLGSRFNASQDSEELAPWREAVKASRAARRLRELYDNPEVTDSSGRKGVWPRPYIQYLARYDEVFARSYAQYIAVRSGNAAALRELGKIRENAGKPEYLPLQWDDDDFEPIAAAFDDIFASRKWR